MRTETIFQWKELTDDGLLKPAPSSGSYYDCDDSLRDGSFSDRGEAIEGFTKFVKNAAKRYRSGYSQTLVLVELMRISSDEA